MNWPNIFAFKKVREDILQLRLVIIFFILNIIVFTKSNHVMANDIGHIHGTVSCPGVWDTSNVLVFIEDAMANFEPPERGAVMNQINTTFVPHILPILKGTTVEFLNSDPGWHNVYSPSYSVAPFNLGTYPGGKSRSMTFNEIGLVPIKCSVHAEMLAFVIVLGNPYFGVTDKNGSFEIEGVPQGTYTLRAWHEKRDSVRQEVTVIPGKITYVNFQLK